jgi:hypothetical protein
MPNGASDFSKKGKRSWVISCEIQKLAEGSVCAPILSAHDQSRKSGFATFPA